MKRALLVAVVLACGPCEHERTHWHHSDSDRIASSCIIGTQSCGPFERWKAREECFALCPEADPKVTCE